MFWQILPSKKVDEVGDTVSGSIGPTQLGSGTLSLTKNLPHSKFYHHQMAISLLSLSRQEKRWLLRRSTENQATIKTEHAKTPSHLHNTTGRFNFQGMQNVIDLIDSDNKISTTADSHVRCFTSTACTAGCALCPSCKNSTGSRIMYGLLLLVTLVISCIMLAPGVQDVLTKVVPSIPW